MPITMFEILAVLMAGPRDAAAILDRLREVTGSEDGPPLASFYRAIKRSLERGWLDVGDVAHQGSGPGRPGQVYQITPLGRRVVHDEAHRLRPLIRLALKNPRPS